MKKKFLIIISMLVLVFALCTGCSNSEQLKENIKQEVTNAINDYINDTINGLAGDITDTGNSDIIVNEDITSIPEPTVTPIVEATNTPETSENSTVEITNIPEPTATLAPTSTPVPTVAPTAILAPTNTPVPTSTPKPTATMAPTSTPKPTPTPKASKLRFRNWTLLDQHYEKHGIEMGFASAEEYEKAAAAVVSHPDVLHKIESEDGDDVYYVEATNEFVIVSKDGYIRTYFNPSSGLKYYERQ